MQKVVAKRISLTIVAIFIMVARPFIYSPIVTKTIGD